MAAITEDDRLDTTGQLTKALAAKGYEIDGQYQGRSSPIDVSTINGLEERHLGPATIRFFLVNRPKDIYFDPFYNKIYISKFLVPLINEVTMPIYFYVESSYENFCQKLLSELPDKPEPRIHPTRGEKAGAWFHRMISRAAGRAQPSPPA